MENGNLLNAPGWQDFLLGTIREGKRKRSHTAAEIGWQMELEHAACF